MRAQTTVSSGGTNNKVFVGLRIRPLLEHESSKHEVICARTSTSATLNRRDLEEANYFAGDYL